MHVHFGVDLLAPEWPHSVVCIGTFDGVHLGHQEVIRHAVRRAHAQGLPCVLATFDRHPAAILAPERCPPAVASLQSNLRHFEELGVAVAVVLTFDRVLGQTTAAAFFENVIEGKFRAQSLVVGHDFAFGKGREGTPEWLSQRIDTEVVPPFEVGGTRVSSSAVRLAIQEGRVEDAAVLLGRAFEIPGIVVHGQKLGRQLGFPTANLARSVRQVIPADGVYAGSCETLLGCYRAAISIGVRPTIDSLRTIEAYLLDYPGDDLYGTPVRLMIDKRIREQREFGNLEELKAQMRLDVAVAREH